ncbi:hypothetical protein SAMN05216515_1377 [Eubacterium pyruvativorans]|uniref:Uncharacterized protein n=1 Tax=Eubacterium pyruvativorans TaxID=155865 RepID=A0A1I7I9N0_9FIRM|nr:hypothetical protein [Eubacterium pyruvativorans]SFO38485.1 hypothetical protein SAMN05216515_1377 [Eubacterium pyruvativorans]SFU69631.1 hypothetical protein SAMN05216508_1365 [Eubacterium pyruvativorans]
MDYKVNERYLEKVIEIKNATDEFAFDEDKLAKYISSHITTDDDGVKFIFAGYLDAIEKAADEASLELDMTYDTLPNLMPATIMMTHMQHTYGYDNDENAEITMKTLAAYLTLMAVNNHGAKVNVNKKGRSQSKRPELWGNQFYLRINNKRESDLLPYALGGIYESHIEVDNGFAADVNSLIGAYLRITGVNLADYGLLNLVVSFDETTN